MLVKKKEPHHHFVICRYHQVITSENLPSSSEVPTCRTARGEGLRTLGHCRALGSFGFHQPADFSVNIESVAKRFPWTIWYHPVIAPAAIYHPLKTAERCLKPQLHVWSVQLRWENLASPSGAAAPLSCWACCLLQRETQHPRRKGRPCNSQDGAWGSSKHNLSTRSKRTEFDSKRHVAVMHYLPRTEAYSGEKLNNGVHSLRKSS